MNTTVSVYQQSTTSFMATILAMVTMATRFSGADGQVAKDHLTLRNILSGILKRLVILRLSNLNY